MRLRPFLYFTAAILLIFLLCLPCCSSKSAEGEKPVKDGAKNQQKSVKKPAKKRKSKLYEVGYEKLGLKKKRSKRAEFEFYTPEELAAFAPKSGADEVVLTFAGDTMLWDRLKPRVKSDGWDYAFRGVLPLLINADMAVVNLEGPLVSQAKKRRTTGYFYKVPPESAKGLVDAGIDAVSLANNHLLDCDEAGLKETMDTLDKAGVAWFGAGSTNEEARKPMIKTIKGVKIAVIGGISAEIYISEPHKMNRPNEYERRKALAVEDLTMLDGHNTMGTFIYDPDSLAADVKAAKKLADVVVVDLHMGVRYWRPPYEKQIALAKAAAEAGADIVIGHHAHFWQPLQVIDGMPVIYGVGNFAFGSRNRNADEALVVRVIVDTAKKKLAKVELYPVSIYNRDSRIDFQPKALKGKAATEMLSDMNQWNEKLFGRTFNIDNDRMTIDLAKDGQ